MALNLELMLEIVCVSPRVSRPWHKVGNARGLLGGNKRSGITFRLWCKLWWQRRERRRKQDWGRRASDCDAEMTELQPTQCGALEQRLLLEEYAEMARPWCPCCAVIGWGLPWKRMVSAWKLMADPKSMNSWGCQRVLPWREFWMVSLHGCHGPPLVLHGSSYSRVSMSLSS